ncbi:hypothetical protein Acsp04_27700 [Actinomadura sp. NBRC 104425]|uniref:DUF6458 family protein n=1 Tax=Actinomadura sp. NBRC 104425 TaxID=3032204 RepID=UPI0024A48964|nr:DUF6458 family protein [Actinomadura sp. NBRC 104425]GLZ12535.1 hypothetical protein Acsp04_27700 [Actinomadura sp. NBRC 104425]
MGIGVSLAFITAGAILAFALRVDLSGVDIRMVGWILILVGLVSLFFTVRYIRPRRSAAPVTTGTDPLYVERPDEADPAVHEERVIGRQTEPHIERVERIIEPPAAPPSATPRKYSAQDPAVAQDPEYAQDPADQNSPSLTSEPGRVSSEPGRRTRRDHS